jgi:uncharacterized damage-inducible protein DinB
MPSLRPLLLIAMVSCAVAASAQAQSVPPGFQEEFLRQFDGSMSKFVALAEAMPAERYQWSPGEGVMSVARVYAHVARYNYYYPASSLGVAAPPGVDPATMEDISEKERIVDLLRQSGEHVRRVVQERSGQQLGRATTLYGREVAEWSVLLQLLAHMNEHLGQSIAYARMNGVVPPWSR